jgi:TetR/AcrR family transcriptional repressor of nem operon
MSKAERTKQFIIGKTAPIFNTQGYAGTSLSDMTDATGLTKGSIYGNFADKDEVALACFDHNAKVVADIIRREMEKFPAYRDKLRVYVDVYSGNRKSALIPGGCPLLNTTTEADDTHPALRSRVGKAVIAWKDRIVAIVEAGKANKEFKATSNAEQVALTIIALLEGMLVISRATATPGYGRPVIDTLEKLINEL